MGIGSNFKPCKRTNGKMMMRVNPEPQVIDFDTAVQYLFDCTHQDFPEGWKTKGEVQRRLARTASKVNYVGYLEDSPENLEEAKEWFEESDSEYSQLRLEHYYRCRDIIRKHFPDLEDSQ